MALIAADDQNPPAIEEKKGDRILSGERGSSGIQPPASARAGVGAAVAHGLSNALVGDTGRDTLVQRGGTLSGCRVIPVVRRLRARLAAPVRRLYRNRAVGVPSFALRSVCLAGSFYALDCGRN
jgi:hypothetical protein